MSRVRGETILIVEDDPGVAFLEQRRLEEVGYGVLHASNADDARDCIRREAVDLIILDLALPGNVDGLKFYESLKAAGYNVPVVIVTGSNVEATVIRALRAGARDFIAKSVEYLEYLPEAVEHVLQQISVERRLIDSEARLRRSEQELSDFFANAVVGLHCMGTDGRMLRVNQAELDLLGYTHEEYLGRHVADIHADSAVLEDMLRRLWSGETLHNFPARLRRKDGEIRHVLIDSNALRENGALVYARSCTRDTTDCKLAQDALRESEQRFHQLAENIDDVFWMASADRQRLIYVSPAFETIWGRSCSSLYERPEAWLDAIHPQDRARVVQAGLEIAAAPDKQFDEEYRVIRPDRTVRWVRERGFLVHDTAGQTCHLAGVTEDISKAKQVEHRLARRTEDLARSNAELEQFAYVASHDLQEPLRKVSSFCQLLADRYADQLDADARLYIGYAVDGAKRMKCLITDLLNYSRAGRQSGPLISTDSRVACQRALDNLQLTIEESGATITCDELPVLLADEVLLVQLFQNLIGNALKFRGQQRPEVHIGAEFCNDRWIFSVRDNGIGIAPEHWERIFEVFQRLHSAAEYSGTGIGLAVCKRIAERLGGHIWVESHFGSGSCFSFNIPAAVPTDEVLECCLSATT